MGPDPEKIKRDSSFQQGDFIINQMEEEQMDVDVEENMGYIPLQGNDNEELPADDSTDDEEEGSDDENEYTFQQAEEQPPPNVAPILSSSAELQAEVWNTPRSNPTAIEITNETSQQITQIMSKINLPNAPAWISEISTETLINRLKNRQQ